MPEHLLQPFRRKGCCSFTQNSETRNKIPLWGSADLRRKEEVGWGERRVEIGRRWGARGVTAMKEGWRKQ